MTFNSCTSPEGSRGFWRGLAALGILLVSSAGSVSSSSMPAMDPVLSRGFRHSMQGRADVEFAIDKANLLAAGSGPKIFPSWAPLPVSVGAVPVYLVAAPTNADTTPAAVPRDCRCVFINPSALDSWVKIQSTGSGRLSLDRKYVLVFMLLHELGHLEHKTFGADFANGTLSQLNIDVSLAKAQEEAADEFAARIVRNQSQHKPANAASLEAFWVLNAVGNLAWNLQAYRSLDEFGSTAVGNPSVFFDKNLTHPNLEWRVLRSQHLIRATPESKALLDAFEEARSRGANPQPLYRKP